ncbi:MAG: ribonuclease HII [Euryarchaeota archaeon]|nr:ribonuclease HII [Euryarchaeota archaeon]
MSEYSIGVDEAGRGPVIGPLIVCATSIPSNDYHILREIGAKDSKTLSKGKREKIYKIINEEAIERNWNIGIVECTPFRIDHNSSVSNLNELEATLFSEAIKNSNVNGESGNIFLDACDVNQERFGNNVKSKLGPSWGDWRIISEHSMDSSNSLVAASSIVAKVTRDNAMKKLSDEIGIDLGSGYPSDPKTRHSINELISGKYPHDCLRWTWSTVRKAWKEAYGASVPIRYQNKGVYSQTNFQHWIEDNHK